MIDYHTHTSLCGHATGKMEDYVKVALLRGLDEVGFSDHLPIEGGKEKGLSMTLEELPHYVKEVERIRREFPDIRVKLGIEAEYVPGNESFLRELLGRYRFDYVIGSVHNIGTWAFDHPDERDRWTNTDVDTAYADYFELLRQSARTGLFDIIGHSDLVKKFGHRSKADLSNVLNDTAQVFKQYNLAVEINTSGLRKPVREIYPSEEILTIYQKHNIPIVFGSDAHVQEDVGRDFDKAVFLAKQCGYTGYVSFKQRKRAVCEFLE
ncbi:MAG: histidinol-phosphatase HisJ family protein [Planctomycetes bacterium]|nr:histidinol-phosphatase HisJ family protein [Planctomycetota bacterium]